MQRSTSDATAVDEKLSLELEQRKVDNFNALMQLIKSQQLTESQLTEFIEFDPDILSRRDSDGRFPLVQAIFSNDNKVTRLILDHGADIHQTYRERTPIAMIEFYRVLAINDDRYKLVISDDIINRLKKASRKQPPSSSQHNLMQIGKMLGYDISEGGVCHGYSHMAMQAFLLKREDGNALSEFDERMVVLKKISPEKHVENLAIARAKIIKISDDAKREFLDDDKSRQTYIDERIQLELSKEEKFALELPAFYEGVVLYQNATKNNDLFEKDKRQKYQAPEPVVALAASVELERAGGILSVDRIVGVYNKDDMTDYFENLRRCAKNSENDAGLPVAMVISSNVHSITVTYDPKTDEFSFIDANESENWTFENKSVVLKFKDAEAVASATREAFQGNIKDNESLVLNTTMFAAKADSAKAIAVSEAWRDEMREIHRVTPEKVKMKDKRGGELYSAAIRGGDLEVTRELHSKPNFFRRHRKAIIGFVALGLITGVALAITAATLGAASPLAAGMIAVGITVATGMAAISVAAVSDHLDTRSTKKVEKLRRMTTPDNDIEMSNDSAKCSHSSTREMTEVFSQSDQHKKHKRRKFVSTESEVSLSESSNNSEHQIVTAVIPERGSMSESEDDKSDQSDQFKMR